MNGATFQDGANFDKGTVSIYVEYVSGVTGAIATVNRQNGVASIVRTGVGTIDVILNEPAFSLLYASGEVRPVTFTNTNGCYVNQKTDNVATPGTNLAKVTFEIRQANTTAPLGDTTTGDVVQFYIELLALAP